MGDLREMLCCCYQVDCFYTVSQTLVFSSAGIEPARSDCKSEKFFKLLCVSTSSKTHLVSIKFVFIAVSVFVLKYLFKQKQIQFYKITLFFLYL